MKTRILSILAILLGLMPGMSLTAYAEGTTVDLSTLTGNYTATDGDVLSGTASGKTVTIPNGATVTLNGVNITNGSINCAGNATIILMGDNTVTAASNYAAIQLNLQDAYSEDYTLTITGTGSITAQGGNNASGIGSSSVHESGNIVITGGTIIATGGNNGAGIGSGYCADCKNITITDGGDEGNRHQGKWR